MRTYGNFGNIRIPFLCYAAGFLAARLVPGFLSASFLTVWRIF